MEHPELMYPRRREHRDKEPKGEDFEKMVGSLAAKSGMSRRQARKKLMGQGMAKKSAARMKVKR